MKSSLSRVRILYAFVAFVLVFFSVPHFAFAILPPDIIFAVWSQAAQLWAFVGTVVVGSIVMIFPMFTTFFKSRLGKVLFSILGAVVVLWAWSYVLLTIYRPTAHPPWMPIGVTTTGTTTGSIAYKVGHRFYSDRFVFVGKRTSGDPIALEIFVNRKELVNGGFIHYYTMSSIDGKISDHDYQSQLAPSLEVLPNLMFSGFARSVVADHSSRESFKFSLGRGNKKYEIETSMLEGDFITKNEPENTEYLSVGHATLRDGIENIEGNILFQRTYSTDYRPTLFFEGYETLPSEATQVVLWDDEGSFYLADKSDVHAISIAYSSHFWALTKYKDSIRKAFSGELEMSKSVRGVFTASIPSLGIKQINVTLKTLFPGGNIEGYGEGELINQTGSHVVHGIAVYNEYGQR